MTDLALGNDGQLDFSGGLSLVKDDDALLQRIKVRLRFFVGDWFLDLGFGVPYFSRVFVKGPNQADLYQIFQNLLATTPGVALVEELSVEVGSSDDRTLRVSGSVLADSGELVPFSVEETL